MLASLAERLRTRPGAMSPKQRRPYQSTVGSFTDQSPRLLSASAAQRHMEEAESEDRLGLEDLKWHS
jgi:hypothetical protein